MSEEFREVFEHRRICSDDQRLGGSIMHVMVYAKARIAARGYLESLGAVQRLKLHKQEEKTA